jgi:hypothetical protein
VLTFARPLLLAVGILAALVPLVLHLIARRPAERVALPTARFLAPDERTAVRLRRRPTDPLLLALRMLLLALLGAAAAGPSWLPAQRGTVELVLLDRSAGMTGEAWAAAVRAARQALLGPDGSVRGALVLFDSAAVPVARGDLTAALFDSLAAAGPGGGALDYAAALRAVPGAAVGLRGADSVRVTLLSAPRWDGWSAGLARARAAAWPGAIRVPDLPVAPSPAEATAPAAARRGEAVVVAPPGRGRYVAAALGATGWDVRRAASDSTAVHFVLPPLDAAATARLRTALEAGATVIVAGEPSGLDGLLPWRSTAGDGTSDGGTLLLDDGTRAGGAERRAGGRPAEGARLLAAWDDGRPAAAAARVGRGCAVHLATNPEAGRLPLAAEFPRLIDRLARGCDPAPSAGGAAPLDAGARAVLRGTGGESVALAALGAAGGGIPLGRWILGVALLVALVETLLAYGRRRSA